MTIKAEPTAKGTVTAMKVVSVIESRPFITDVLNSWAVFSASTKLRG